jgi:hypothetical protein
MSLILRRYKITDAVVIDKPHVLGAVQKCSDARHANNRTVKRIWIYAERCGLQRNTADERFSTALRFIIVCVDTPFPVILQRLRQKFHNIPCGDAVGAFFCRGEISGIAIAF